MGNTDQTNKIEHPQGRILLSNGNEIAGHTPEEMIQQTASAEQQDEATFDPFGRLRLRIKDFVEHVLNDSKEEN